MAFKLASQQLQTAVRGLPQTIRPAVSLSRSLAGTRLPFQAARTSRARSTFGGGAVMAAGSFYDLKAKDIDGNEVDFSKYKGKVLLVVNIASNCGFTPQYNGVAELQKKYASKGFEVLAFPCNQFGGQEPGDVAQLKSFAKARNFDGELFAKIDVNGPNASPVFQLLKQEKGGLLGVIGNTDIRWNWQKFLVGKDGTVVKRYGSVTTPEEIEPDVVALL